MNRLLWGTLGGGGAVLAPALGLCVVLRVPSDYPTIQAGVDAASAGDTVLVAPGLYDHHEVRSIPTGLTRACVFLKGGVVLRSEGGAAATTIHLPDDTVQPQVLYGEGLLTDETVVEGFAVTAVPTGYSAVYVEGSGKITFRACVFRDLVGYLTTAGVDVNGGDADILDCQFIRCRTLGGGAGIYHSTGSIRIRNCRFEACVHRAVWLAAAGVGNEAIVENSVFVDCYGDAGGGAVAIGAHPGGTTVRGSLFIGNSTSFGGGGALIVGGSSPMLVEACTFVRNHTTGSGGGVSVAGGVGTVRGNTFVGNGADGNGGAVSFSTSSASGSVLEGNVIAGCVAAGAVYRSTTVTALVSGCNVFWDNVDGNTSGIYTLGASDRVADPLFCDSVTDDYTLRHGSPCLPENSQGCGQIGALGEGCGTVAVDHQSWGTIKGAYREGGVR